MQLPARLRAPRPSPQARFRHGLLDLIAGAEGGHWFVVSAPAGFGKTTFAAHVAAQTVDATLWLRAHETRGPDGWWAQLGTGLEHLAEGSGAPLALWASGLGGAASAADALSEAAEGLSALERPVTVVLDDADQDSDGLLDEVLARCLERDTRPLRWIVLSRSSLPFALAAVAASNLTLLGTQELRLEPQAALDLLQAAAPDIAGEQLAELARTLDGWPAGLQVAAVALGTLARARPSAGVVEDVTRQCGWKLDAYLRAAVIDRLDEESREFLLRTSPAARFDAELAARMSGSRASPTRLWREGLFLERDGSEGELFRLSGVFRRALLAQAREALGQDEVRRLAGLAAAWSRERGAVDEALAVLLECGDREAAVRVAEQESVQALRRGEARALLRWCDRLDGAARTSGRIGVARAWAQMICLRLPESLSLARDLAGRPEVRGDRRLAAECRAIEGVIQLASGQAEAGLARMQEAAAELPPEADDVRAVLLGERGVALAAMGQLESAQSCFSEALVLAERSDSWVVARSLRWHLAELLLSRGDLPHALARFRAGVEEDPEGRGSACAAGLAELLREQGEVDRPRTILEELLRVSGTRGHAAIHLAACVGASRVASTLEDHEGAAGWLEQAQRVAVLSGLESLRVLVECYQAMHELRADPERARRRAPVQVPSLPLTFVTNQARELPQLVNVRLALARGEGGSAVRDLELLRASAEQEGRARSRLEIDLVRARLLFAGGEEDSARHLLAQTEAEAHGLGFQRLLLDEPLEPGLRSQGESQPASGSRAVKDCPLTERELEVLSLVADGHTNASAARRLFVAPSTVKKHLENVYPRIGADNRTHAVTIARERGWLAPA